MAFSNHSFHIPVMGTSFTIDSPLRVARFGINSCISLGDDLLIEQMRKAWSHKLGLPFEAVSSHQPDARAQRITAYLNFLDAQVKAQMACMRLQTFGTGSELDRYFEMLPDGDLASTYWRMFETKDLDEREACRVFCLAQLKPGSIDVNLMTKVNRDHYWRGEKLGPEMGDALSGLRGFVKANGTGSMVFSAGMNPRLFAYAAEWDAFMPDTQASFRKKLVLKVSDYRSALIQGQQLAKKGLWVSEFRIESGLNCGGHAFAKEGLLMGPVLEEFKENREMLLDKLFEIYRAALHKRGISLEYQPKQWITAQGGIGTGEEDKLLRSLYKLDGTGWGTPFLLVPEATLVDEEHFSLLQAAKEEDVFLSQSSPFGIPFWTLKNSASERLRKERIQSGRPGSPCPKKYLVTSCEFTERPLCTGSQEYQAFKLKQILESSLNEAEKHAHIEATQAKACICHDLAGAATRSFGLDAKAAPAVCPGPNIAYFSKSSSLKEMVAHIYGRLNLCQEEKRPHIFIKEGQIYVQFLKDEIQRYRLKLSQQTPKTLLEMQKNLIEGLNYYSKLAQTFIEPRRDAFLAELQKLKNELNGIQIAGMVQSS